MKSKALSAIIAVCLCVSFGASVKADTWQPSPEIRMAVAGMKNAVANVKYMRAQIITDFVKPSQGNSTKPPKASTSRSPITKIDVRWQIADTEVYLHSDSILEGGATSSSESMWKKNGEIYDLSTQWPQFTSDGKINPEGRKHPINSGSIFSEPKVENIASQWRDFFRKTPLTLAFNDYFISLADFLVQEKAHATFKGYEYIDGNTCMKIETHPDQSLMYVYWIDVNHGFVVYRAEHFQKYKGKMLLASETQASHLIEYGKTWLPKKVGSKIFWTNGNTGFPSKYPSTASLMIPPHFVIPPTVQTYTIQDVSIGDKTIPPIIWSIGTSLAYEIPTTGYGEIPTVVAISQSELEQLDAERKSKALPALREFPIETQKPGLVGVALKDSEVKQLKSWRTTDKP